MCLIIYDGKNMDFRVFIFLLGFFGNIFNLLGFMKETVSPFIQMRRNTKDKNVLMTTPKVVITFLAFIES